MVCSCLFSVVRCGCVVCCGGGCVGGIGGGCGGCSCVGLSCLFVHLCVTCYVLGVVCCVVASCCVVLCCVVASLAVVVAVIAHAFVVAVVMRVSKIEPCMFQYKLLRGNTANGSLKQLLLM